MNDPFDKEKTCAEVYQRIMALVADETDEIALMATIAFGGQRFFEWQIEQAREISR